MSALKDYTPFSLHFAQHTPYQNVLNNSLIFISNETHISHHAAHFRRINTLKIDDIPVEIHAKDV